MTNCMETWMTILISIPLGAFSSLIAWWILNYWIKPKIKFSEDISKTLIDSTAIYRFKFENCGKRKIVDNSLIAKLRIKGIRYKLNWEVIYLPLDNDKIPIIRPIKGESKKIREVPRLELGLIEIKNRKFLPQTIKQKIENDTISLEELMKLGSESELILYVTGYDEISGAKKTFESKPYKVKDIKNGLFIKNGLNVE